ncbi:MAG: hypothetical protein QNJ92_09150 [Alphaproteobacteria bacterium]|nr:hypothetical protein [Alphaproteobacteria bacterium]
MRFIRLAALAGLVFVIGAGTARADGPFDGQWTGKMNVETGLCFGVRTLNIEIRNGQMTGSGGRGQHKLTVKGSVGADGRTSRTIAYSALTLVRIINGRFQGNQANLSFLADAERMTGGRQGRGSQECFGTIRLTRVGA